jgi:hypothetical protein
MDAPSPEHRVRSSCVRFGLWTSTLAFFVIEGYVLHDQWEIGHASAMYMLGTAFLIAGFCIGLFAIIVAIGLMISAVQREPTHRASRSARGDPPLRTRISVPDSENWGKAAGPR